MSWIITSLDGAAVNLDLVQTLTVRPAGFSVAELPVFELQANLFDRAVVVGLRAGENNARAEIARIASSGARGGQGGVVNVATDPALVECWRSHADPF